MKNVNLLLFLSDYKTKNEVIIEDDEEYTLEGTGKKYTGSQTNDAPVRCLFDMAHENGGCIKRVLCIASHDVKKATYPQSNEPQYIRFEHLVNQLADTYGCEHPVFVYIPYDYKESEDHERIEKTDYGYMLPSIIYDRLSEAFGSNIDHDEVYIDYTGGFRDISFLMTSVIRFLEFKGLKCGAIVYSEYRRKKIYDIHYIYDLYQLINGVSEFVATGNARELQEAYSRYNGNGQDSSIKLIEQLIDISDALSICDISNIEDKINRLIELLDEIDNTDIEQYKSRNEADIKPVILKSITSVIREKMHLDNKIDYPQMIQWCTENNMIQQALTLYTDKMPKYYFDHGFVPGYVVISEITPAHAHDIYDTAFYTELYDRAAEGLEIKTLRSILKSLPIYTDGRMDRDSIINEISKCKTNDQVIMKGINELVRYIRSCYQSDEDGVSRVNNPYYDATVKSNNL